jgi:hypothetical protein
MGQCEKNLPSCGSGQHNIDSKQNNEWNIHVQYADEPDATYIYTVSNGQIRHAGVSGNVDKKGLKHKE